MNQLLTPRVQLPQTGRKDSLIFKLLHLLVREPVSAGNGSGGVKFRTSH